MLCELCPNGVERKPLGQLGTFYSGLVGKTKADFVDGTAPFLAYKIVFPISLFHVIFPTK